MLHDRMVAVKTSATSEKETKMSRKFSHEAAVASLKLEAAALQELKHQHIVRSQSQATCLWN
jgi:putative IMPACT (imprinted ancient) family translation regulator